MLLDTKTSIASFNPPITKLWITETTYNLNGPVISESDAPSIVNSTYIYAANAGVQQIFWYAWDASNLGGMQFNKDSSAWYSIKYHL